MYDSLFRLDETGAVVPDLVTAFEYNEDQTELTLDLDTSATFDDGSTLSAELVARTSTPATTRSSPHTRPSPPGVENEITAVNVVDEDTVTLVFAAAKPGFESNLVIPVRRHRRTRSGGRSVCARHRTGWLRTPHGRHGCHGQGQLLRAGEEGGPPGRGRYPFDSYEFRPILDPQARVNAAISGEVDIANITADTQEQVESAGVGLVANGGTVVNLLPFDKNGTLAPQWADPRVWQALSMAIDRDTYVNAVHPGEVPTGNALPADSPGYLPELEDWAAYDPEGAKELLAEAGYPDGFDFEFVINQESQRDLEALQPYWAEIGVDVTLKNAASTEETFAAVQTTPMGGPIPLTWTNPVGNVFGVLFGFANFHKAENAEIQAAVGALGAAGGDEAATEEALGQLNTAIVESGWLLPLYEQLAPWAYDTAKVAEPTFPGAEAFPILSTIQPAG